MSVPLAIHVALIASSREQVASLRKAIRLHDVGSISYVALDAVDGERVVPLSAVRRGVITLWLCLDREAHAASVAVHARDRHESGYSRGFYDEHFPEPCVLLNGAASSRDLRSVLSAWAAKIREAHAATS